MNNDITQQQQKLHSCQLLLAAELKRICQKHNVAYYMIAGTLLGAVRHGGFIPWDDDMDFAIMRKDYDKFLSACKKDLSDDFILQEFSTDEFYGMPMAKLMLKGTRQVERVARKNKALKGIYIDVFPYDSIPNSLADRKKHSRNTYVLKRLLLAKQKYKVAQKGQGKKAVVYALLKFISFFISKKRLRALLEAELTRYAEFPTEKVAAIGGAYPYEKESVERKWFIDAVELPFEGITLSAPVGYKEYLKYFYGDYMTPPPEDKRGDRHNIVELDFGKYN